MNGYQFSLRTLLASIAVVGVGAALWIAEPSWQVGAVECVMLGWLPGSAAVLSVCSSGKARSFWIGFTAESILPPTLFAAFIGFVPPVYQDFESFLGFLRVFLENLSTNFRTVMMLWTFAPVVGLLCVLTHWLLVHPPEAKD
jgi:hypothetical protein